MATKKTTKKAKLDIASMKNKDELQAALVASQAELVETRRSLALKELTNTRRISELKAQIARINTALNAPVKNEEKA